MIAKLWQALGLSFEIFARGQILSGLEGVEIDQADQFEACLSGSAWFEALFVTEERPLTKSTRVTIHNEGSRGSTASLGPRLDDECRQLDFRWGEAPDLGVRGRVV